MTEVTIERVVPDGVSDAFVVLLREKDGKRLLPIWIRRLEAESIAAAVQHAKPKRPLTHDLCKSIIGAMGGSLQAVHITGIHKDTYYAELLITQSDGVTHVDSRPSDAMAIAVRMGAPIYVHDALLGHIEVVTAESANATTETRTPSASSAELSAEELKAYLEKLRPEDFGKFSP
ncbi:MAG: bifunctional nuclease family protein [Phycisphaerae bacterium]|nr:bifunctional nuclease family protein [Gemmatimonadaceae bacterium]